MKQIPFIAKIIFFWYKISTYSCVPRRVCRYSLGLSSFAKKSMWIHAGQICVNSRRPSSRFWRYVFLMRQMVRHCLFCEFTHFIAPFAWIHSDCTWFHTYFTWIHTNYASFPWIVLWIHTLFCVTSGSLIPVISLIWIVWIHSIVVEISKTFG